MSRVNVNPEVLAWARETAGLSLGEAAQKLQLSAARGLDPEQRMAAYESGEEQPTRTLLLKMSKAYRRSLLAFYLFEPPRRGDRGEDFRRVSEEVSLAMEGLVDALVRDVKVRQSIVRSVLEDEDEATVIPFVGSMTIDAGVDAVTRSIRQAIGFDLQTFRHYRTIGDAFAYVRSQVEAAGAFVLLIGDLGSHHTALSVEVFRGCALADSVAPFVVINDQDAKSAWAFTLFHELAHIWIGQTGISASVVEAGVEQFCNDVASSLLLLDGEFSGFEVTDQMPLQETVEAINKFASARNLSRTMVAYRLFRRGVIGHDRWDALKREFRRIWLETRAAERRTASQKESGPNYFVIRRYRAGRALVDLVSRMTRSGALTSTKAAKVLGVKPRSVYDLFAAGG